LTLATHGFLFLISVMSVTTISANTPLFVIQTNFSCWIPQASGL